MYREVTMFEVLEVLRLWRASLPTKRLATQLGLDPKTVRRYLTVAEGVGLRRDGPAPSDDEVREVLLASHPAGGRLRGEGWAICGQQRERIARWLAEGVRLTKLRKLLARQGVLLPYPTLPRVAVEELRLGRPAPRLPVVDGGPGQEVQPDTGWVGWVRVAERAPARRRFGAWIFTAGNSRHRVVHPTFEETTARAIEACEAAWRFFGGVFPILIPDNTKAIVVGPDALSPRITPAFLEYAQARGIQIDPARVRHPEDKARVEREERPRLLPAPTAPYAVPIWTTPNVAREQLAQVARALYSMPYRHVGRVLTARADGQLVRFYDRGVLIKAHARQPPGDRPARLPGRAQRLRPAGAGAPLRPGPRQP